MFPDRRGVIQAGAAIALLALLAGLVLFFRIGNQPEPGQPTPTISGTATVQASATLRPTLEPTETGEQTGNSATAPAATRTGVPVGTFVHLFYPNLVLDYAPGEWADRSEYDNQEMLVNFLESTSIESCTIGVMGPSGFFPENMEAAQIGKIAYLRLIEENPNTGLGNGYYFENDGMDPNGMAVFIVQAAPAEWERCQQAAEAVLATLHPVE